MNKINLYLTICKTFVTNILINVHNSFFKTLFYTGWENFFVQRWKTMLICVDNENTFYV